MSTAKVNPDKSKPAKPDKPKYQRPPRRKNRFNFREFARAGRVGQTLGAERVEVDPATGKISIILPTSKGSASHDPIPS